MNQQMDKERICLIEHNDFYDVRAIYMTKTTKENPLPELVKKVGHPNSCICLGHFDFMEIKKISNAEMSPFACIHESAQEDHFFEKGCFVNYTYPIYIIKQAPVGNASSWIRAVKDFWELSSNYIVVSRFHCDRIDNNLYKFAEQLEQRCNDVKRNRFIEISGKNTNGVAEIEIVFKLAGDRDKSSTVWATFYDSLDLGEIIGVFKGESLAAILEAQRHISECSVVSDDYTYCGISVNLISLSRQDFESKLQKQHFLLSSNLPYISTRFSIKDAKSAYDYCQKYRQKKYYVIGNEDIIVTLENCKETQFLQTMKQTVDSCDAIYEAFNDVITRVGLIYTSPFMSNKKDNNKATFSEIVPLYNEMLERIGEYYQKFVWAESLFKLLATLRTMHENCVMDDLSMLVIPGVRALLDRLCYLKDIWDHKDDEKVSVFIDHWAALLDDIARVESQLVHHPELSPSRYYIPATLLHYEMAIIRDAESIIWKMDSNEHRHRFYAPIIFPTSCKNTSTICVLDPKVDTSYYKGCPISIAIPLKKLYQPWKMAHILVHEIAHYCGEKTRCRKDRWSSLCECVAEYILILWNYHFGYSELYNRENPLIGEFKNKLVDAIQVCYPAPKEGNKYYLSEISRNLPRSAAKLAHNYTLQAEYRDMLIIDQQLDIQLRFAHESGRTTAMNAGSAIKERLQTHISNCLIHLYKECYADIVMILLLKCSFSDYYDCVYAEECSRYLPRPNGDKSDWQKRQIWEKHTDRLAIVSYVIDENIDSSWSNCEIYSNTSEWARDAKMKAKKWRANVRNSKSKIYWPCSYLRTFSPYALLASEAHALCMYLSKCAIQIKQALESSGVKEFADKLISNITISKDDASFDWRAMRQYVENAKKSWESTTYD